jgi:predicted nucleic acid-binding protein
MDHRIGSTGHGAMAASNWLPAGVAAADPEDDFLLAMALAGDADFLLTGDRRAGLLQQGTIGRTRVASPAWFCAEAL